MKKQEEQKHFLSLMARIGDYIFIDISKLDIANGYNPYNLADIDSFTMHFSKEELLSSIKRANLVSDKYLNGKIEKFDNNDIEIIFSTDFGNLNRNVNKVEMCVQLSKKALNENLINSEQYYDRIQHIVDYTEENDIVVNSNDLVILNNILNNRIEVEENELAK